MTCHHNTEPAHDKTITKTCLFKYTENFPTKKWKFSDKNFWYFSYFCSKHRLWVLARTPRWGGSNEYPQSMLLSRNKKNNVYPCKPKFYYIKVGFKGSKLYRRVFVMPRKWHVRPAKTQISLLRVFTVRMKKACVLSCPWSAQWRLRSDWADAKADLSLRWAHMPFVCFVMCWLQSDI